MLNQVKIALISLAFATSGVGETLLAQSQQKAFTPGFNGEDLRPLQIGDIVDSQFLKDSTHIFTQDEIDSTWVLFGKRAYHYGVLGEERAIDEYERKEGEWKRLRRLENSFNNESDIILQKELSWESDLEEWVVQLEREFTYNYIGLISSEITHQISGSDWERNLKTEYRYTDYQNVDRETQYIWDVENKTWVASSRKIYEYFDTELVSSEILQIWIDSTGKWENQTTRDFEYDEGDNLISSIRSNWDDEEKVWVNISMVSLHYNEKGQLEGSEQSQLSTAQQVSLLAQDANYDDDGNLGEIIHSNWNSESGSWEDFKKEKHFWSEKRTGTEIDDSNDITCTFSNPYIMGFPWYCESLKEGVQYTLDLYDITGRHFHALTFIGGNTFRIRGNIPGGVYIAVIRGGLDTHTEKVIFRD
ncbi:MAG: T9SS type A sorting domain-containing protein [Cryomorphaceae bacterium]|nr:T9SS type A sorting domain-containing protein [Flavobacteriales bacterium]